MLNKCYRPLFKVTQTLPLNIVLVMHNEAQFMGLKFNISASSQVLDTQNFHENLIVLSLRFLHGHLYDIFLQFAFRIGKKNLLCNCAHTKNVNSKKIKRTVSGVSLIRTFFPLNSLTSLL